jgi:hypothetical protein
MAAVAAVLWQRLRAASRLGVAPAHRRAVQVGGDGAVRNRLAVRNPPLSYLIEQIVFSCCPLTFKYEYAFFMMEDL